MAKITLVFCGVSTREWRMCMVPFETPLFLFARMGKKGAIYEKAF